MAISRRKFLLTTAVAGSALAVGYVVLKPEEDTRLVFQKTARGGEVALNAWIKIDASGTVTVAAPRAEMGQGIYTALAMLVAEELDVDWKSVQVQDAPVHQVYANREMLRAALPFEDGYHQGENTSGAQFMGWLAELLSAQGTGGSTSIRDAWEPMRNAGACARHMLVQAAASKWNVPASECLAADGTVSHNGSGKSLSYGDLATLAASLTPPENPPLKNAADYKLIGKAVPRLDITDKTTGRATFGVDVKSDGMLYAAVNVAPVMGGSLKSYDREAIVKMPGVVAVAALPTGIAVVADSWWRAKKAADAAPVDFEDGGNGDLDSEGIYQLLEDSIKSGDPFTYRDDGDADKVFENAGDDVVASYQVPYLAHACMEPMNCTARVDGDNIQIWMPNQAPFLMRYLASRIADTDVENVQVFTTYLGGGFGRRAEGDLAEQAVRIAMAVPGKTVKLLWSREDDMRHDMYRPAARSLFRARLDDKGRPFAWFNRIAGQVPTKSFTQRIFDFATVDMPDNTSSEGSADMPYAIPNLQVQHVPVDLPVPVGFWRSVGHSYNAFFTESFMDELAHKAGQDPYKYRRDLLEGHPDYLAVLDKVASAAEWDLPMNSGRGRGIALHESFGSLVAQVAEVSVMPDDTIQLDRVVCVVDCGRVINPDTVVAQIEGAIVYGLTAALYGEVTLKDGAVEQGNFPDYEMIRLNNMPNIEVILAPSGRPIGGIGEVGTPPIAPALANAIFNATGKRVRELPLSKAGLVG
ncbi:MAG: xanthine dehydrogenase family protein molybdopterin-binding subunit [Alphaproteobacteria bacterium]|jgi:isoquinoline 1-oxidoreductase subunit beta|nr:xanthine dehydrogenase family protein molybdopterin-binding subunit [Alphaproteobacteria bacterium]MBT4084897.1 xanthine dehydrogenase family protein molybdopterin-binding subunit [Alphaproteobacteria bacterium]MBT4544088.1 xanthine dehydrogenase family protein molybdopterin-binding subunit [Alphaproteobacteria bacterium]MBT7747543.1 xanthine dehydrogenase family protein molybdopterin-binding subunit [Alphaproteobacteria bacterium]